MADSKLGAFARIKNMSAPGKVQNFREAFTAFLFLLIAAILIFGVYDSIRLAWMCDDAFISFRYAKNLVGGLGLVYNAGEYVDGYTNFLWTIIMALGLRMGIDPVSLSRAIGISSYILTILVFLLLSRRLTRENGSAYLYFPLAALCLSLHHDYHVYATSGLETSFFIFLVSIGFYSVLLARRKAALLLAGFVLTLSILTRPEGMIFFTMAAIYILLVMRGRRSITIFFIIPFILIYVPYWIWHLLYYGYPFPNTYYAKSAYLPYYDQGLSYLGLYLKTYYVLLAVPILFLVCAAKTALRAGGEGSLFHRAGRALTPDKFSKRVILLSLLFTLPFLFYVIRVGGDFMFARFLLPITPFLFLLLECLVNRLFAGKTRVAVMIVILALTFARSSQFTLRPAEAQRLASLKEAVIKHAPPLRGLTEKLHATFSPKPDTKGIGGITYEPFFYPQGIVKDTRVMGERMKEYFKDMDIVVGYLRCMLVYYADFPVAIEIVTGLTDRFIAHQPIDERARPGHEKPATDDYLRKRRMNFTFCSVLDTVPFLSNYDIMSVRGMGGSIFIYDNEIMEKLRKYPDIQFIHFPSYLDDYIQQMPKMPRKKVLADYERFSLYYFDYNNDPNREKPFRKLLDLDTSD